MISCTRGSTNVSGACYPASVVAPSNLLNTSTADPIGKDRVRSDFVRGTLDYKLSDVFDFKTTVAYRSLSAITEDFRRRLHPGAADAQHRLRLDLQAVHRRAAAHRASPRQPADAGRRLFPLLRRRRPALDRPIGRAGGKQLRLQHLDDLRHHQEPVRSGYLHGEFAVTPRWTIAGGARYTMDDRFIQPNSYNPTTPTRGRRTIRSTWRERSPARSAR
ncbi:MAG: hypothetical protein WDN44_03700 [Sphingomonas sp.]